MNKIIIPYKNTNKQQTKFKKPGKQVKERFLFLYTEINFAGLSKMSEEVEQFVLEEDEELQFNITLPDKECIVLELTHGTAEIFGFELQKEQKYNFYNGTKFSLFTFHGCTIQVKGNCTPIRSKDHPMIMYLQIHASLEKLRKLADESSASKKPEDQWSNGPITMIVEPTDVGKSTLCRLLLNYGVRMGRRPVFVDLDVGQGSISLPGKYILRKKIQQNLDISCFISLDKCFPKTDI